jgi:ribosomal protein S18 acetylase RimI-like enzyme
VTSSFTIRPAREQDAEAIAQVWRSGWLDAHLEHVPQTLVDVRTEESFVTRAAQRIPGTTVASDDGAVVGFVMVVDDEVEQVYVAAAARGTGVADALIREAESQVLAGGHEKAWLAVVAGNARARAFYERAGWSDEGGFDYEAAVEGGTIAVPCRRYTKLVQPG